MAYAPVPMARSSRPGGYPSQKPDFLTGLGNYFSSSDGANALIGLGTGLLSAPTFSEGLAAGGQGYMNGAVADDAYATSRKETEQRQEQLNQTIEFLRSKGREDLIPLVGAGQANVALTEAMKVAPTNEYDTRFSEGQERGLVGDALNTFALTGSVPGTARSNVTYGVNPIYGRDTETGQMGMGVQGSDGSFKIVDTGNFQPLGPYDTNAQKAAGTAFGKGTGQAQFDLPSVELSKDQTVDAIAAIRAEKKGMEEQFGNILGVPQQMTPAWPQSDKAKFQVAVQRGTDRAFMEAREMLRGGGQITDFEGKKAENAITNMQLAMEKGDKAQFEAALTSFEDAVNAGYEKLKAQAAGLPSYGGASNSGPKTPEGSWVYDAASGRLVRQ